MKLYRVYADTSVFGGCYDDEFAEFSNKFFSQVHGGLFKLIISPLLLDKLSFASEEVQGILKELPKNQLEYVLDNEDIENLRDRYISSGILTIKSKADAEHVALATYFDCDFLVSWNYKHLVHFQKINGYQAVNLLNGYKPIKIFSPREVAIYEKEI